MLAMTTHGVEQYRSLLNVMCCGYIIHYTGSYTADQICKLINISQLHRDIIQR